MLQKFSKNKNYSGFSFIEAILAVFLISTGMIVVMSLMSSSLKESMGSRDQIVGVLLSQEGIELVRNLRDNNWANDRDTFDSIYFPASDDMTCSILSTPTAINNSPTNYNISGIPNKFQRKIQVDYDDILKNTAEITSVVIWGSGGFPASLNNCSTATKCAYTKTTLTRWGGM
ncbi:MAG: hypothetical protein Q7U36_02625 [bacterium]|nr:hypothetical protein [bacterium]